MNAERTTICAPNKPNKKHHFELPSNNENIHVVKLLFLCFWAQDWVWGVPDMKLHPQKQVQLSLLNRALSPQLHVGRPA